MIVFYFLLVLLHNKVIESFKWHHQRFTYLKTPLSTSPSVAVAFEHNRLMEGAGLKTKLLQIETLIFYMAIEVLSQNC